MNQTFTKFTCIKMLFDQFLARRTKISRVEMNETNCLRNQHFHQFIFETRYDEKISTLIILTLTEEKPSKFPQIKMETKRVGRRSTLLIIFSELFVLPTKCRRWQRPLVYCTILCTKFKRLHVNINEKSELLQNNFHEILHKKMETNTSKN